MKRDAEIALRAYFEALSAEPIPAIEVRIGRRMVGPALPLAAGACAAAFLPLLTPAGEASDQVVMGRATLQTDPAEPQSFLTKDIDQWVV